MLMALVGSTCPYSVAGFNLATIRAVAGGAATAAPKAARSAAKVARKVQPSRFKKSIFEIGKVFDTTEIKVFDIFARDWKAETIYFDPGAHAYKKMMQWVPPPTDEEMGNFLKKLVDSVKTMERQHFTGYARRGGSFNLAEAHRRLTVFTAAAMLDTISEDGTRIRPRFNLADDVTTLRGRTQKQLKDHLSKQPNMLIAEKSQTKYQNFDQSWQDGKFLTKDGAAFWKTHGKGDGKTPEQAHVAWFGYTGGRFWLPEKLYMSTTSAPERRLVEEQDTSDGDVLTGCSGHNESFNEVSLVDGQRMGALQGPAQNRCVSNKHSAVAFQLICGGASGLDAHVATWEMPTQNITQAEQLMEACVGNAGDDGGDGEDDVGDFGDVAEDIMPPCDSIQFGAAELPADVKMARPSPDAPFCSTQLNDQNQLVKPICSSGSAGKQQVLNGLKHCMDFFSAVGVWYDVGLVPFVAAVNHTSISHNHSLPLRCALKVSKSQKCVYTAHAEMARAFASAIGVAARAARAAPVSTAGAAGASVPASAQCQAPPAYTGGVSIATLALCTSVLVMLVSVYVSQNTRY